MRDIAENILLARSFVGAMTAEEFAADTKTYYAVPRCLEIISEASRRLPSDLKSRYPDIAWRDIAIAGNVYRHHYDNLVEEWVWDTANRELEALLNVVQQEIARSRGG